MTLSTQFITLIAMIGMGALFGALLDTYQRFLKRPKRKHWLVFFNDLLFWVIQALLIFYVLYLVNKGELRFYIFIALFCGFSVYQSLLKGIYMRVLEWLIKITLSLSRFVKRMLRVLIYKPAIGLIQLFLGICFFIGRGLFTLVKFIFRVIIGIIKTLWRPVEKFLLIFWKLLPKRFKKTVEKIYNKLAGYLKPLKNIVYEYINRLMNKKK